ncbi:MAG TPA: hypothetical protein VFE07_10985 [Marmoricola sp.]|jgi:hypothetical protein|nr:hypothetical protein [Marmoricola sp.]
MRYPTTQKGAAVFVTLAAASALALAPVSLAGAHASFTPLQASAATAPCKAVMLPVPDGWSGGVVDINDSGVMVGSVTGPDGVDHATYWTPSAGGGFARHTPDLPAVGELLDVNNAGEAVGFDDFATETYVLNTVTGAFKYLPDYAGTHFGRARRINSHGVVAGAAPDQDGTPFATTWAPPYDTPHRVGVPWEEQAMTWTDPDTGDVYNWIAGSEADGINDAGTVAVFAAVGDPHIMRAHGRSKFSREPGNEQPLESSSVPAVPMTKTTSGQVSIYHTTGDQAYTFDLDNGGIVIGDDVTDLDTYDTRPVYWSGSAERDLGLPADAAGGRALNIDGTWVTGFLYYPDGTERSYVWTGSGLLEVMPTPPGYVGSLSHGVDQLLHEVGGFARAADGRFVPVMWRCPAGFSTAG